MTGKARVMTGKAEQKSFETPDETAHSATEPWTCCGSAAGEVGRLTLQPGWRWSQDVKPIAGTERCEASRAADSHQALRP